ncbi:MAG: bifunctional 5,10-methylenetetrahydrofolate dehydrogenase/5,10-methenyltetrahydrofolate cyclohydrolase [Thermaerobacter sp.]|nr:bifunctional 5,10-methylenetetrahydrofolate dehydrogenase/5,10-methenyltetrahydrofolate cyclohydrolase [Thermaerobacter sp.]
MAQILDGQALAAEIYGELQREVQSLRGRHGRVPGLRVVAVGEEPASYVYARNQERHCRELGIDFDTVRLPREVEQGRLLETLEELNADPAVDGILLFAPLPPQLDQQEAVRTVDPGKDVEGLHPVNLGNLLFERSHFTPCTPGGVITLLKRHRIPLEGRRVVIVGHSPVVGKPAVLLFLAEHATATCCHQWTTDLGRHTREADVLMVAVGKPGLITAGMVRPGSVVVDVGITRVEGKLVGDVDFAGVSEVAGWITPVPGGVGPMTVCTLLSNTVEAARRHARQAAARAS